jgi:hypothetical protein
MPSLPYVAHLSNLRQHVGPASSLHDVIHTPLLSGGRLVAPCVRHLRVDRRCGLCPSPARRTPLLATPVAVPASSPGSVHRELDFLVPPSLPDSAINGWRSIQVRTGSPYPPLPPPPSRRSAVPLPFLSSLPSLARRPLLHRVSASSPGFLRREPNSPVPPSLSLGSWPRWLYWHQLAWWRSVQVRTGSFLFWWLVTSLGWIRWMDSSV